MRSDWFFLVFLYLLLLTDNSLQFANKHKEMRAVSEKLQDAVVKFDACRNLLLRRTVLPAIARHLVYQTFSVTVLIDTKHQ